MDLGAVLNQRNKMPSPVTGDDFTITALTTSLCDAFKKMLSISGSLKLWFDWAFNDDGTVTNEFLREFNGAFMPIGCVVWTPVNIVPAGFLACNGQEVSKTTYANLYAIIGDVEGTPLNPSNFIVPDLQDLFLVGASGTKAVGVEGGEENHTLTVPEIPAHTHNTNILLVIQGAASGSSGDNAPQPATGTVTSSTGGGGSHNNMPPYRAGIWLIKF